MYLHNFDHVDTNTPRFQFPSYRNGSGNLMDFQHVHSSRASTPITNGMFHLSNQLERHFFIILLAITEKLFGFLKLNMPKLQSCQLLWAKSYSRPSNVAFYSFIIACIIFVCAHACTDRYSHAMKFLCVNPGLRGCIIPLYSQDRTLHMRVRTFYAFHLVALCPHCDNCLMNILNGSFGLQACIHN